MKDDVAIGAVFRVVSAVVLVAGCSRDSGGTQPRSDGDGGFAPEEIALVHCAERLDQGSIEEVLAQRRGKLVPGAVTFCPKRQETSAHVNFRYRAPQTPTGLRVGRAVSVTANCDDAMMGHKDAALFERLDPETGCRPIL